MNPPRFDEVVFMDDFFRSADNQLDSHPTNLRFLRALLAGGLHRFGMRVRQAIAQSDGGTVPVATLMQQLGLDCSVSGWAAATVAELEQALDKVHPMQLRIYP
jgi:hypothetical protein